MNFEDYEVDITDDGTQNTENGVGVENGSGADVADSGKQTTENGSQKTDDKQQKTNDTDVKEDKKQGITLSDEEYKALQKMQHDAALKELDKDMKAKYTDFDLQSVLNKILDIDEKNPGFADKYLNEIGIENIHLQYFANKKPSNDDEFDIARSVGNGGESVAESIDKINNGTATATEKIELYSKLF